MVRTIYQQLSPAEVHGQLDRVVEQLREPFPQVAELWILPRCRLGLRTSARASQRTTTCWEARRAAVTLSEATSRSGTGSCGLLLLEYMAVAGMTASGMVGHLFDLVGEHRYERRDVGFNPAHRAAIMERLSGEPLTELAGMPVPGMDEIDGRRWMLDVGWVAARFSGTESYPVNSTIDIQHGPLPNGTVSDKVSEPESGLTLNMAIRPESWPAE